MSFWDSSALLPLVLPEETSNRMRALWAADDYPVVWWATLVECEAAISRRIRERLSVQSISDAESGLGSLAAHWREVPATGALRDIAGRVVRTYPLRAADSLQLAAALIAADGDPAVLPFVTLDTRLGDAAAAEGFNLLR